ncbi:hypothetical protein, variant [Cryptococcus amylolentus CBS 6039]|uniref:Eukaryotic translation initiation factor 4E n=2 Tax=Cryptococcus amylolentus TaxID=104669 RepID=A0A1E3I3F5_9TREE|nr:hypothetical protein, variant [Cryptococcus amylolentus CBS 6039]ODN83079.1 hypothetical protein, variant [Cryptococcus amylolentus CBS 6039]ODO10690.1 hypothetical protein I350_01287 [Cryptococcus amylolentus CBS 6273]
MSAAIPQPAAAANTNTLNSALQAENIHNPSSPRATEKPLEEGEIEENAATDDGKVKTVFDDASKFNVKHPLFSNWTLYFDSPQSKNLPKTPGTTPTLPQGVGSWMDDIRKVVSFDSVEEFWGLYNNIVPPSQLPGKANYYLFKNGIVPAWEDPQNKNGGKWAIQIPKNPESKSTIDKIWLYTMLAAIGETFETPSGKAEVAPSPTQSDLVTGVIVSPRPAFFRISIWTREAADASSPDTETIKARLLSIGQHFKSSVLGHDLDSTLVGAGYQTEVTFDAHRDSDKKQNKNKFSV